MAFRFAGTITGCRGVDGAMVLKDVPREIASLPENIPAKVGYSLSFARDYTLMRFRTSGSHGAVARLREVNSREQAREMKEYGLFVDEDDIRSKNEKIIFDDEMIGSVVTDIVSGEPIGKIIDTMELPANDIWIVDTPRGELPLPVTDEVIIENDSENKRVAVRLPEGIWELAKGGDNE